MIPTLDQVVTAYGVDPRHPMVLALRTREDQIADVLRQIGAQFGLHPEIVAEVLSNYVPLGTQLSDTERQMIHTNYVNHIEELRRQMGDG